MSDMRLFCVAFLTSIVIATSIDWVWPNTIAPTPSDAAMVRLYMAMIVGAFIVVARGNRSEAPNGD